MNEHAGVFVPPYDLIMAEIGAEVSREDEIIGVPRRLLDFLLKSLLEVVDFDEYQYLECNSDVAEAVEQGKFESGYDHFIRVGYFEGRTGWVPVDDEWYMARNPDVARAVVAQEVDSASAQYRSSGIREWRAPNPAVLDAVDEWRNVLGVAVTGRYRRSSAAMLGMSGVRSTRSSSRGKG